MDIKRNRKSKPIIPQSILNIFCCDGNLFCLQDSKGLLGSTPFKREAQQLLSALGLMRGFMKPGGVPDETRAARLILKDFVTGKLLLCRAPPQQNQGI